MSEAASKSQGRKRRHRRLRRRIRGTRARPRMNVYVSNAHMYVQFIDDDAEATMAAASTLSKDLGVVRPRPSVDAARELGRLAARKAMEKGIKAVVFDRGGGAYKARLKALADAAREEGLVF
jgi:large subunit ribosomal protein L18